MLSTLIVYGIFTFSQACSSGLQSIKIKAEPSAEGLQCLQSTVFQNYCMTAAGQMPRIITKLSSLIMKLKGSLIENLENTGSSFQLMVN